MRPQFAEGWFSLGLVEKYSANFTTAQAAFAKAYDLKPEFIEAHRMAMVVKDLGQLEQETQAYLASHPLVVSSGVMKGLHYIPMPVEFDDLRASILQKLQGNYEKDIDLAVNDSLRQAPDILVNIGTAEGYYAVGYARLLPHLIVHGYDIDPIMQNRCEQMAALNGVADRVHIHGLCSHTDMQSYQGQGKILFFLDCEGAELSLLDPKAAPILKEAMMLVELHDLFIPDLTPTLLARFRDTHKITLLSSTAANVFHDGRGAFMQWAYFVPNAA